MNWLYLIPVVCVIGLAFYAPVNVLLTVIYLAGAGLVALWLTNKISGK